MKMRMLVTWLFLIPGVWLFIEIANEEAVWARRFQAIKSGGAIEFTGTVTSKFDYKATLGRSSRRFHKRGRRSASYHLEISLPTGEKWTESLEESKWLPMSVGDLVQVYMLDGEPFVLFFYSGAQSEVKWIALLFFGCPFLAVISIAAARSMAHRMKQK